MNLKKQLFRLNAFGFFTCLRIPDAVWVVLLTARGFCLWEIGLAEGIFHAVSLLCEIPSGMASDLIGRRRSLAMAGVCGAISALFMAFSTSFLHVCLSMVFSALASSFISGSDEALLYDSLLQSNQESEYLSANAQYSQMQNLGTTLSNVASFLSGVFGYVGFYLLDAAVCLLRVWTAGSLVEPVVTKDQLFRKEHPFCKLGQRFRSHVSEVYQFLFSYPRIVFVMLADGLIGLPGYLTLMFLQQRLHELGLKPTWLGIPVMCLSLSRMLGVCVGERLHPKRLRQLYVVCALLVGVGTVCAGTTPIMPAVLGAMVASGAMDAWVLHLQKYLNERFPSDRRATLVSVNMMSYSLLMILVSPLIGWIGDICGTAGAGLCILGIGVTVSGLVVWIKENNKLHRQ